MSGPAMLHPPLVAATRLQWHHSGPDFRPFLVTAVHYVTSLYFGVSGGHFPDLDCLYIDGYINYRSNDISMCAPRPLLQDSTLDSTILGIILARAGRLGYVMSCHVVYLGLNFRTCLSSEPACFEQLVNSVTFEFRPCSNVGTLERRRTNNSTMILLPPPFIHSPKSDICRWFLIARLRCPSYS